MNPVALISGAGRGIGRAAAVELAKSGYRLALLARTRDELEETRRLAGNGLILPADVTQPAQVSSAIDQTVAAYGRLDALVNCAGVAPAKSIEQTSVEDWREVIDSNLSSAFYLCKFAWPHLKSAGGGAVVLLSSQAARDPFPGFAAYAPAKAGINLLTLVLSREGEAHGIRVYAVAPGAVETAMFRKLMTPEEFPPEKAMSPAEVARVIVQCIAGDLRHASGETIYLRKTL